MAQHTLIKNNAVSQEKLIKLQHEVDVLRSVLISLIGEDEEGKYQPSVVQRILRASTEESEFTFKNGRSFLQDLAKIK